MSQKDLNTRLIVLVIVISLLVGAGSGAVVSFTLGSQTAQNSLSAWISKNIFSQAESDSNRQLTTRQEVKQVEEESATITATEKVMPAVVSIIVSKDLSQYYSSFGSTPWDRLYGWPFEFKEPEESDEDSNLQEVGGGTGFIVSTDGKILTNRHVISDTEAEYTIITSDDKEYQAEILATDPTNDIGILKIDTQEELPIVELGDSDNLEIGQTVIAIGNTLSRYRNTVTKGVVSALSRSFTAGDSSGQTTQIEGAIQTDAAINPGNSGGPLINLSGQVVGINTAIANPSGISTNIGVGFAIPINQATEALDSLEKYGKIVRPFLGIRYVLLNERIAETNNLPVDYGALIIRGQDLTELAVVPGSPADKAGLEENDIILEFAGQKLDQDHSLARELLNYKVGAEVELKILHDGTEKVIKLELGQRD